MTRLDRLIFSELIGPFFGAAMLFTALAFAGGELMRVADYLQKGESILIVVQLILVSLPGVMTYTFPMAMLLATLLGFGRLSADSEIIAITAAGVSFERVIAPVAIMGLAVSLLGVWFNNAVAPAASRQRNTIIEGYTSGEGNISLKRQTFPIRSGRDGSLLSQVIVEGEANLSTGELKQVTIVTIKDGEFVSLIFAPKAVWKPGTKDWILQGFWFVNKSGKSGQIGTVTEFENREISLDTPSNLEIQLNKRPENIDTAQLLKHIPVLRTMEDFTKARKLEVEVARRNSIPFAAFAFGLVGAALGVRPNREGKGVGFGLSVIVTFTYYIMLNIATIMAQNGVLPANIALMIPNVVGLLAAIFLIRRVMR
jgi:lipopolysaccharide export system permease protein